MSEWEQQTVYVTFGPKGHQVITGEVSDMIMKDWHARNPGSYGKYLARAPHFPLDPVTASAMLTGWREDDPYTFGQYLARAMTGETPKGGRS